MLSQEIPLICPLCRSPMTTSGEHQVCSIGCGHLFGYNCIMEYFSQNPDCPFCQSKIHQREMRLLFFDNHIPFSESVLGAEHKKTEELESNHRILETKKESYQQELDKLKSSMTANKTATYAPSEKKVVRILSQPSLILDHDVNDGNRVMICGDKLIFTEKREDGVYGIQVTDIGDPDEFTFYPIHAMQIKDICAYRNTPTIIVTVSMDQTIGIVNTISNQTRRISAGVGLWSCVFINSELIAVGGDRGSVICFDIKNDQKIFERSEPGPPVISLDLIDDDIIFACTGRNGRSFSIAKKDYLDASIKCATIVKACGNTRQIVVLTRKDKIAHAMLCNSFNGKLNAAKNIPIKYFSRLVRPSLCAAGEKMYCLLPNEEENDMVLIETNHPEVDLWIKWKNRFSHTEKPLVDLALYKSDDFLLAALTQNNLRVYALPIEI